MLSRRGFTLSCVAALGAAAGCEGGTLEEAVVRNIVLLGDSVFDNAAYVGRGPDVVRQLRTLLPEGSTATLAAVDGAVVSGVARQLETVPADATHLVVSAGGNDALGHSTILNTATGTVGEAVDRLNTVQAQFTSKYSSMLDLVLQRSLPTAVCTIYEPRFPDQQQRRRAATALAVLNDIILREAFRRSVAVLDLRLVCSEDADFANPIEPSVVGGAKIARTILSFVSTPRLGNRSQIFRG